MSLLSGPQGRPHTVRALVKTIKNLGELPIAEREQWLLPGAFGDKTGTKKKNPKSRIDDTLGCATSLGWITTAQGVHRLTDPDMPVDSEGFFDHLHATLCSTDKPADRRILEAYAFVVIETDEKGSTEWLRQLKQSQLADRIDAALRGSEHKDGAKLFNPTKVKPWQVWLEAMGLAWDSPSVGYLLPDPIARMERELLPLVERFGTEREVEPHEFRGALAERMPYLDGGVLHRELCERMGRTPAPDRVSHVLARALFELEDEGILTLHTRGDAAERALQLPRIDSWTARLVVGVTLHGPAKERA